ncbi:MAG: FkbM family methyltransferase [Gemmataceae bacterium]
MGWLKNLVQRFQFARHLPRHWRLRPRTLDARIVRQVLLENEYRLPERFAPDDQILDIGGHIGAFALACLQRGAQHVHVFEPEPENFALLEQNLAPFAGRAHLHRQAVWRSDASPMRLGLHNPVATRNTGAHRVAVLESGPEVPTMSFDSLLQDLCPGGRRLRLVKLDCEGAEWPILLTSRRLGLADALCGEYHLGPLSEAYAVDDQRFGPELLRATLGRQGFAVTTVELPPVPHPCGLFFASRNSDGREG